MANNVLGLMGYVQDQGNLGRQRGEQSLTRRLGSQIIGGDPAATQQLAAMDPKAAAAYQGFGDDQLRRMEGLIGFMEQAEKSGNPQAAQMAWQQHGVPYVRQFANGTEPTSNWAEAKLMLEGVKAKIAMAKAGQQPDSNNVQSRFVANDGTVWALMQNGQRQQLTDSSGKPIIADRQMWLRDQPGLTPGLIGKDASFTPIGGQPQGAPQSGLPQAMSDADAEVRAGRMNAYVQRLQGMGLPVEQINELAQAYEQDVFGGAPAAPQPMAGGIEARPAIAPAEAERLRIAEEANQRANEANQRAAAAAEAAKRGNAPTGFRFRADGSLEPIPGGPKPAGAAASEDERKAAAWLVQASNAYRNMADILKEDASADDPGFIETYSPSDELANRTRSAARQKYFQAASSLSEALLRAATGAGITRDEAAQKIRELTPQRGDTDAVKQQKLDAIPVYIEALRQRAGRAAPKAAETPPQGGNDYSQLWN